LLLKITIFKKIIILKIKFIKKSTKEFFKAIETKNLKDVTEFFKENKNIANDINKVFFSIF
jgi:hypothetical protein